MSARTAETDKPRVPELHFPEFEGEWEEKRLDSLLTFKNGVNADKSMYGSGYKFINVLDIIADHPITHDSIIGHVAVSENEFAKNEVVYGDVLFQRSSEVREETGQSNVYLDKYKSATFGGFVIRGKPIAKFDPFYFNELLKTSAARKDITSRSGGSTRYNVGQESLAAVIVSVSPSLIEQKKIAAFLGAVDEKLQALREKEAALVRFKRGLMQQLFSRTRRFTRADGSAYPDWEEKRLGDFCEVDSGYPVPGDEIVEKKTDIPLLRGINITEGNIRHSAEIDRYHGGDASNLLQYLVAAGDMVIGMDGSKVGKNVAIIQSEDEGAFLIQRVARAKANNGNDLRYVYHHVTSINFRRYVDRVNTSSGIPHISLKQIRDFPIYMPHPEEQKKIADALTAVDVKISAVSDKIAEVEAFKRGLLQKMFV